MYASGHNHSHSHGVGALCGRGGWLGSLWVRLAIVCVAALTLLVTYQKSVESQRLLRVADDGLAECNQKHDSVAAQLQVVYEHKSRLERSLDTEKKNAEALRQKTDADIQRLKDELTEKLSKYGELSQQHDNLQRQMNEMKEERLNDEKKDSETVEDLTGQVTRLKNDLATAINDKTSALTELEKLNGDIRTRNRELSECQDAARRRSVVAHADAGGHDAAPGNGNVRPSVTLSDMHAFDSSAKQLNKTVVRDDEQGQHQEQALPPYRAVPLGPEAVSAAANMSSTTTQPPPVEQPPVAGAANLAEILMRSGRRREEAAAVDGGAQAAAPTVVDVKREAAPLHNDGGSDDLQPQQRVLVPPGDNAEKAGAAASDQEQVDFKDDPAYGVGERGFERSNYAGGVNDDKVVFRRSDDGAAAVAAKPPPPPHDGQRKSEDLNMDKINAPADRENDGDEEEEKNNPADENEDDAEDAKNDVQNVGGL